MTRQDRREWRQVMWLMPVLWLASFVIAGWVA